MAQRGVLGCAGALVGVIVALVLGWLALELVVGAWSVAATDGPGGLVRDALLWHQAGQLLVVGGLILALFTVVFRPGVPVERVFRPPLWLGAALEVVGWLRLPGGSRVALWALTLAAIGIVAPFVLGRARERGSTPAA